MRQEAHRKHWHKNWQTWFVVALLLAGIDTYILTPDDSLVPPGGAGNAHSRPGQQSL